LETGHSDSAHATHATHADPNRNPNRDDPRVAVIAIHGVGQHLPGASADAVSTLLLSIGRNRVVRGKDDPPPPACPYSGFATKAIDVPLRPVQAPPEASTDANYRKEGNWLSRAWSIFDERRGYLAKAREDAAFVPYGYDKNELRADEPDRGEFGYQFMLTQVSGYQGEVDRDFQTVRLEGGRAASSPAATVHIYDAHYSDLSKPQSSIVSFFFAFYQLLFHLASLSLQAVYWVEAENLKAESQKALDRVAEVKKEEEKKIKHEGAKIAEEAEKAEKKAAKPKNVWRWRVESSVHATSIRLLIMWIPFLNLILLEISGSTFIGKTHGWAGLRPVALALSSLLSLGVTFWLLRQKGSPSRPFFWALVPIFGTGLGVLLLCGLNCLYRCIFLPALTTPIPGALPIPFSETLLLLSWLIAAGLVLVWIAWKYDPLRPGALTLAVILYLVNVSWFLFYLVPHAAATPHIGNSQVSTASLWAAQWIFGELLLTWIFCLGSAFLSWLLSILCKLGIDQSDEQGKLRAARAHAAFRTGRFAFAVPAILFVIVTSVLWSGVLAGGSDRLKAFDEVTVCDASSGLSGASWPSKVIPSITEVETWIKPPYTEPKCSKDAPAMAPPEKFWGSYLRGLLLVSVTPGLLVTMGAFLLSLLLLVWAVLPSIFFEVVPKWTEGAVSEPIRSLGEWLSRGLDNIAILTRLLWFVIVPVPLVFFLLDWLVLHTTWGLWGLREYVNSASHLTLPLIERTGLAIVVSGTAVLGVILKTLTTVLDAILDVDNYLRTSPLQETPRARIDERCVSLLRYIAAYRDEQGRPYTKLIIVAHSLGSMVTTDLLRYLERSAKDSPDPDLDPYEFRTKHIPGVPRKLPICVFSMGSPLRQLLNRFFPHLYWWVSDIPDNSLKPLGVAAAPPPKIESPLPRTDEMNATHWTNAYRSGDYIGRSLWVGQWLQRNATGDPTQDPDRAHHSFPRACTEMCIGLGAHTHYWDRSAPEIGKELDRLILAP
jgi:hypothetical protein